MVKKVLIVGSGAMGCGIAYVFASKIPNLQLHILETNLKQQDKAIALLDKWRKKDIASSVKDILSDQELTTNLTKLRFYQNGDDVQANDFDLLLEAASENIDVKKSVFRLFDRISNEQTIIASNTSSLSLTLMSSVVVPAKQKNVIGMHFFNPAKIMKLLEIIATESTSPQTLEKVKQLGALLGKEVVVCKDSPGFITSRLGIVFLNEAIFTLQEGLASAEDIDKAIKLGYNHPMGPLTLADYIGLDVVYAVLETLYENYRDSKYRPCLLLKKKIEAGHLGRKTGKGFFVY